MCALCNAICKNYNIYTSFRVRLVLCIVVFTLYTFVYQSFCLPTLTILRVKCGIRNAGTHCIVSGIQLLTMNNLGGT